MEKYKNLGGNSSILGFRAFLNSIHVHFKDGSIYEYTIDSAGLANIETMKQLAQKGRGLNSFIMNFVKHNYSKKIL